MAAMEVDTKQTAAVSATAENEMCSTAVKVRGGGGEGLRQYYLQHYHDLQLQVRQKTHNLNRLEAQRNDLNSRVRMLRDELQLLQEPGSYVGEVVKVMGKSKVLVKAVHRSRNVCPQRVAKGMKKDTEKNMSLRKLWK